MFEENYVGTHPDYEDVELPEPLPVWPFGVPHGEPESPDTPIENYLGVTESDLLEAIAAVENEPYGLALKAYLDERYAEPINHSRLYQNLSTLAEQDLINRDELDARTNEYTLTNTGRKSFQRHADTLASLCDQPASRGGQQ